MRTRLKLLALLAINIGVATGHLLLPSNLEARPPIDHCPNSSCHGQPFCTYYDGWTCMLAGGPPDWYCNGNDVCQID